MVAQAKRSMRCRVDETGELGVSGGFETSVAGGSICSLITSSVLTKPLPTDHHSPTRTRSPSGTK